MVLVPRCPPEKLHITPGCNFPHFGNRWVNRFQALGVGSAGLTMVAIATGPAVFCNNLIYYTIYKIIFSLRSQYYAKFARSSKRGFQLNVVCVQKFMFDSFCTVTLGKV